MNEQDIKNLVGWLQAIYKQASEASSQVKALQSTQQEILDRLKTLEQNQNPSSVSNSASSVPLAPPTTTV